VNKKVTKKPKAAKTKISTVVAPADLEAFYARYADVCKAGMTGMKKRDRSAKKKGKAKKGTSSAAAAAGGKATKA
jgi:signal recognition particle subunit SRP14